MGIKEMAKQQALKKILKTLMPKAVTGVLTFQNHQVDPKYYKHRGLKGSIMMIPDEAGRRRSDYGRSRNRSTKSLEPTSPTVSCMGQIKLKKNQHHRQCIKKVKSKRITLPNNVNHARPLLRSVSKVKNKKLTPTFPRIFLRTGRKSSRALEADSGSGAVAAAPALNQMKRYTSGRGTLANFDWKQAHVVVPEDDDDDEDDGTIISFSEPILNLHPKTEINLWKRRNMAPPPPLRSNPRPAPI